MQTLPNRLPSSQQPVPQALALQQEGPSSGRTVLSADLLRGGRSVEISHNGSVYRLQSTKLGKLILTK